MREEIGGAVRQLLRGLTARAGAEDCTDGSLLARFAAGRDEEAFADLVKRHGPLVWGVCRRILGDHDAEDAFQASFLLLARKAGSVRSWESVRSWLYGVALRMAHRARAGRARRQARERPVVDVAG